MELFEVDKEDKEHTANWMYWYNSRFKPVFTKTMSVLKGINPKNSAEDAYDLKDQEEYKYYVGIKPNQVSIILLNLHLKMLLSIVQVTKQLALLIIF